MSASASSREKTVAVIGASANRAKYGNISLRAHVREGWSVYPIHPTAAEIEGHRAYPSLDALPVDRVDRVTLYVPANIGITLLGQIAAKSPAEVWVNPGAESEELLQRAEALGLPVIAACSIMALESAS